jgi:tRNA(Leu) C34 or U34 (ribose-2'-O)-methylase TrmL
MERNSPAVFADIKSPDSGSSSPRKEKDLVRDQMSSSTLQMTAPGPIRDNLISTYHVYHKHERLHYILTPKPVKPWDRLWPKRKKKREEKPKEKRPSDSNDYDKELSSEEAKALEPISFFIRKPIISFKSDPPRVLMRGRSKNSQPIALIHSGNFWRSLKLQFGDGLAEGVIDPRGVVSRCHHVKKKLRKEADLKGYKVRTWRLWGESGKAYHRAINERRKQGFPDEEAICDPEPSVIVDSKRPIIDEVVMLDWVSPISTDPRRYHFRFRGMDFYWKGTGTVKESRFCGMWFRYNHLKLVIKVPLSSADPELLRRSKTNLSRRRSNAESEYGEICLAKYTSLVGKRRGGRFEIYDDAVQHIHDQYLVFGDSTKGIEKDQEKDLEKKPVDIRQSRLYSVLAATGVTMVMIEWQKRETIRKIIEILAGAGEGGGG